MVKKVEKITVAKVLAKKKLVKEINVFYSDFFDCEIDIEKIQADTITNIMAKENVEELEQYKELIYHSCPFFRQKELHEELEIKDPLDAVGACYGDNICEIYQLGNLILKKYGFTSEKAERVKKQ